ncbi:TIGR04283 family arsenosugar biosynthesis glycosyltransferase [Dissulfurirhabdus thermomarina]|nr:TIGR04283 family arsenosugar biosynthesis glycosyltransferase [Dissulfurirhabdus thermomarina]
MSISVVIPMLETRPGLVERAVASAAAPGVEVLVVDGGSGRAAVEAAARAGARVLESPPGRARQMNAGAAAAGGDVLLFLHADTRLPPGYPDQVRRVLAAPGVAAGAFPLRIDGGRRGYRLIERLVDWRSRRLETPYGDQALFLRREVFAAAGGFPDLPIMEDYEMVRRLRRMGRIGLADDPVVTSARRWERLGLWRTTLWNRALVLAYRAGVAPERLARLYGTAGRTDGA